MDVTSEQCPSHLKFVAVVSCWQCLENLIGSGFETHTSAPKQTSYHMCYLVGTIASQLCYFIIAL